MCMIVKLNLIFLVIYLKIHFQGLETTTGMNRNCDSTLFYIENIHQLHR